MLVLGLACIWTLLYFKDVHRSVELLTGADVRIFRSVDLAAAVAGLLVGPTVLAIAIAFAAAQKPEILAVPALGRLPQRIRENVSALCQYLALSLILVQMTGAGFAWWPRVLDPHPAGLKGYDPAAIIDLVVAVLGPAFHAILITAMLSMAWDCIVRAFGRTEDGSSEDPATATQ